LSRPPLNGKLRCPDCGVIVASVRDDDSDDGVTSRPSRGGPAERGSRRPRRHADDEDSPFVKKGGSSMAVPIVIGVTLGLLGLLLVGGGIAGVVWMKSSAAADAADAADAPAALADAGLEPIKAPEAGPGEKGKLPLQELKAATVYIKTMTPGIGSATGSGFVVRASGNTVYVATNHHVIAALKPEEVAAARRGRGRGGFVRQTGPVSWSVVFRSGTPQEQSLGAVKVAEDASADLAVLKVTGVRDVPHPIDCNRAPKLEERLPVVAFGFPFGADLDPDKANPSITVTNGSVSSLRRNRRGELVEVQIQGEVNPGNSGGPLVDESGALVGVVVAKIDGTGTAFAVPVEKLNRLLDDRNAMQDKPDPAAGGGKEVAGGPANPPANNPPPVNNPPPANRPPANPPPFNGFPPPAVPARGPAGGEELTKLLADLKSKDAADRQLAAELLAQSPPRERHKDVAAAVRGVLGDAEPATRTAAAKVLAAVDPKEAAPALAKLVEDQDAGVRGTVLKLLKDLKDPRAAEAVAARLPTDALPAVEVLKAMGPGAEKAVIPFLDEKYAGPTRFWAMNILKDIGTGESLPALKAIQGPDTLHAKGVIEAVGERLPLTKEEWAKALDDLKSADAAVRTKAARRIAYTAPVEERKADVVSKLEVVLNDQSAEARVAAVKGLGRWSGKKAIPTLAARLQGFDPGMHAVVIDALADFNDDEAAAAIAKRLPDVFDRPKATQALKAMDPPMAEKAILPLLKETNVFVRVEAVKVLADVGGKDSVAPLEQLVGDNNVFYSGPAADALLAVKSRTGAK
jgi:S1-C subfamily serine protease/HEAT repeat protein